ncbi:hypothetical protein ABOC20_22990, partial [Escherichia coli]
LRTSFPNKTPAISKLELVLDIYPSLSLILRYIYCLVFQGASSDFILRYLIWISVYLNNVKRDFSQETLYKKYKIQLPVAKDTISLAKKYYTT